MDVAQINMCNSKIFRLQLLAFTCNFYGELCIYILLYNHKIDKSVAVEPPYHIPQ